MLSPLTLHTHTHAHTHAHTRTRTHILTHSTACHVGALDLCGHGHSAGEGYLTDYIVFLPRNSEITLRRRIRKGGLMANEIERLVGWKNRFSQGFYSNYKLINNDMLWIILIVFI